MTDLRHRYFTTPIFYANGNPHAGHIYTIILSGILKLHYLSRGHFVQLTTGLDEHGEAVLEKAKDLSIQPQELVDKMAVEWKKVFDSFNLPYDVFIRTTSQEHVENIQNILTYCYKKGDIYFGEHEGYYCVKCESFLTAQERDSDNNCLVHKRPTEVRKEKNYFFKTSKYFSQIKELISKKQLLTQDRYANELLGMLDNLEGDLSISRPKSRLTWGIELPFDKEHVAYVWFDALPNYVTGVGGLEKSRTSPFWKNAFHILGKDILKFHGIFWPAMCLSLDIPVPKLLVTGWLLKDGHKMSKSLGNVFDVDQILGYGIDMFVNYVFRIVNPGYDIDISMKSYVERYNADLANGIGNLLSRTLTMVDKYFQGVLPSFKEDLFDDTQKSISKSVSDVYDAVKNAFDEFRLADGMAQIWTLVTLADREISRQKPWELAKDSSPEGLAKLQNVLAFSLGLLRSVGYLAYPFFPSKMKILLESLGESTQNIPDFYEQGAHFYQIKAGYKIHNIPRLFDRFEEAKATPAVSSPSTHNNNSASNTKPSVTLPQVQVTAQAQENMDKTGNKPSVSIEDFNKISLRIATVISAEHVEGSQKLLRLVVSLGSLGEKQIFSGIKEWVKPEEIANKKVMIVSNLNPRKMKFGLSEGMLLTATETSGKVSPIYVDENLGEGSEVL